MFVLCLAASMAWAQQPGTLDPSFDLDGLVIEDHGPNDRGRDVIVDPDGKIVVAGASDNHLAVWRYMPDGSPDVSFGNNGVVKLKKNGNAEGNAIARDANGMYVVVGSTGSGSGMRWFIARFDAEGVLDPGLCWTGYWWFNFGSSDEAATAVAVQPDGNIVVGGWARETDVTTRMVVIRILPFGYFDSSFGGNGRVDTTFSSEDYNSVLNDMVLEPNGNVTTVGHFLPPTFDTNHDLGFARILPDGTFDPSFGTNGKLVHRFCEGQRREEASAVVQLDDGRYLVGGRSGCNLSAGQYTRRALMMVDTDGTIDTSFGVQGLSLFNEPGFSANHTDIAIAEGTWIVASGYRNLRNTPNSEMTVSRFHMDGTLDTTFSGGAPAWEFTEDAPNYLPGLAVQDDGKVVAAGFTGEDLLIMRLFGGESSMELHEVGGPGGGPFGGL